MSTNIDKFVPYNYDEDPFCPECKLLKSVCTCNVQRKVGRQVTLGFEDKDGIWNQGHGELLVPIEFEKISTKRPNPNRHLEFTKTNSKGEKKEFVTFGGQINIIEQNYGGVHQINYSWGLEEMETYARTLLAIVARQKKLRSKICIYDKTLRRHILRPVTRGAELNLKQKIANQQLAINYAKMEDKLAKKSGEKVGRPLCYTVSNASRKNNNRRKKNKKLLRKST